MKPIIVIFILFSSFSGRSCSCKWAGDFLDVCENARLIVMVEIKRYNISARGAKVRIIETYKGKSPKKITVWGDNGIQCRPYIQAFKKEGVYILASKKHKGSPYFLSNCGEYFLSVRDEKVKSLGRSTERKKRLGEMDLNDFLTKLKAILAD